jgi:hypothetical protein
MRMIRWISAGHNSADINTSDDENISVEQGLELI